MHLAATARISAGIASTPCTLPRSTGESVELPNPMYVLDDGMVAIPHMELTGDEQITINLNCWAIYDMEKDCATGLELTGPPSTDFVSRVAARYVREARHLTMHERSEWVEHIVAEAAA